MSYSNPYRLFLPQHTPSKHRVVALYKEEGWDELKAIATFDNRSDAVRLSDALNELLAGTGLAPEFVSEALQGTPGPVRAEVGRIAKQITDDVESDLRLFGQVRNAYLEALVRPSICGVMRFPVVAPLHDSSGNEIIRNELDRPDENDHYEDTIITPRTAEALRTAGSIAIDELTHPDLTYVLPAALEGQKPSFYKKLAQCFRELVDDLDRGEEPIPRNMGEEVALWLMLDDAEGYSDEDFEPPSIRDLPEADQDFNFDDLRDVLYQDHDFRDLLSGESITGVRMADIFKPFSVPSPRPRKRPTATRT